MSQLALRDFQINSVAPYVIVYPGIYRSTDCSPYCKYVQIITSQFYLVFQVSWIRKRDLHILTVGILTYTNDQRFQAMHSDGSDEWTLKVTSPQVRDSGIYECQVSTEPKISQAYKLSVVVSKAEISGNMELYIKSGSDINLTCTVLQTPEPPSFIYWYRGDHVINYSQRGGISVVTEKQTRTSRLLISRALPADSGNYTCAPSTAESASVLVHVLN
ncbi:uncharacterized protein LOC107044964, partial [Diachasma alloeum]|uniref:uncharacterized protein LOC107044964 n=1 Tax=Diachasma alloeum TaxID=454923 RepID=UPI0010FBBCD0